MKSPLRIAMVTVGAALYAGLAILASGGWRAFFAVPARVALVAELAALYVAALFAGGNLSPGVREDRTNRWVLPVFGLIGLLQGFLPAWAERRGILTFGGDAVRWLGVAVFGLGGALRLWPVYVLGDRFSGLVAIQSSHTLVTDGVYRVIRHPSYLGLFLTMIGWALIFRSGLGLLLAGTIVPPLVARIRAEEGLLAAQFGEEYAAYRARTWRLLPGIY